MHVFKSFVRTVTDGITNKGQFPGNRVAKVTACALSLTSQALKCLRSLKSGQLSEAKGGTVVCRLLPFRLQLCNIPISIYITIILCIPYMI